MKLTVFGVDPGSRTTGFGIIEVEGDHMVHVRHGVIQLGANESFPRRMAQLSAAFRELIEQHRPQVVVLERIFLGKNVDSVFKLGHARGVLMAEASAGGATLAEYAARQVKKGVTGNGGASKEETQMVVQNLLGLGAIQRLDASDALALACYFAFESRKAAVLKRALEM